MAVDDNCNGQVDEGLVNTSSRMRMGKATGIPPSPYKHDYPIGLCSQ